MAERSGYSGLQIALHWLIAILIILAWFTHEGAEEAREAMEKGATPGFVPHVAFGLAVLALVVVRLIIRLTRGAPAAPGTPGSLQVLAAVWGHRLIYLLMIGVPLGGISIFFLGMDNGDIHGLFANVLMIVVLGHSLMAIYHHFVLKDGLIRRMMKPE
ncbi:cytochrome b [Tabrizicola sp.]|uniref:cytochrome b n=1 Tax=Tabrizicola sp. TaxID=2005166 RepID=UPI003F328CA8